MQLPQETQTTKLTSLPSDLRKIADDLIAEKFDVREEVVPEREQSFRGESPVADRYDTTISFGHNDISDEPWLSGFSGGERGATGVKTWVDFQAHRRISTAPIIHASIRGVRDAIQVMDRANIPRQGRVIRFGPQSWLALRSSPDSIQSLSYNDRNRDSRVEGFYQGSIFGCPIFVAEGAVNELEATY